MLLFPFPGVLEEFFTADIFLGNAHALELGHHLAFRGNGSMVRSGHPAGVFAVHAGFADKHIVQGIVKDVSHVQDTRHVGRRNHNGIRLFFIGFAVEKLVVQPILVPFILHLCGTVLCS